SMTVENFSRPRKPSVRSQNTENPWSRQLAINRLHSEPSNDLPTANQTHLNNNTSPSPWSRTRGLSTSSSRSTSTFSSVQHRPSNDHLRAASRTGSLRRANPPPTSTSNSMPRPPLAHANSSTQPLSREIQPWLTGGDEIRSSFRSQLTSSTAQGTLFTASGTERSSVMTKTSSITEHSIINGYARASWVSNSTLDDGPSLEDVMGMYERGFNDSDIESIRRSMRFADADEDDDIHELNFATGGLGMETSRPPSSHSDMSKMGARMLEAMNDQLPIPGALAVPTPHRPATRDTTNNFRKSLQASSLPKDVGLGLTTEYMAKRFQVDVAELGKHDSAKMLDGDGADSERFEGSQPASPVIPVNLLSAAYMTTDMPLPRSATPAPTAQYPVEPPEDPSSRDRYGFRKASANVSREEYDTWDASYTEYLSRRRKKWVAFLKDNSLMTDNPNRFPPKSNKTRRFIRKGIPPDWRGAAWFYYAGGPAILSKNRGVYEDLLRRAALDLKGPGTSPHLISEVKPLVIEDIEKDLHRTFPDNVRFRPPPPAASEAAGDQAHGSHSASSYGAPSDRATEPEVISSLRRVLHAFALYNPRIGYCQSLNFLAGLLLLFVETEEQAFWLLNIITRVFLPGTHEMSLEGSKVDLGVLMLTLKDSLPAVWKQIGGDELEPQGKSRSRSRRGGKDNGNRPGQPGANDPNRLPAITLCMTAWFMSCFIGTLPMETVLRVWDIFFYEGSRTLFRIALTIFKLAEPEIKAVTDPMEMFGVVQGFPRRLVDSNELINACYKRRNGIGHLSQDAIEEKRQERRDGIRRWRVEQEAAAEGAGPKPLTATATAGLDLAADLEAIEVRRKGTLFGRRKDREQVRAAEV
ncbi:rab-GTPase-TBC domain-containing protein, partial [Lasiosphaeris hirsuta]